LLSPRDRRQPCLPVPLSDELVLELAVTAGCECIVTYNAKRVFADYP